MPQISKIMRRVRNLFYPDKPTSPLILVNDEKQNEIDARWVTEAESRIDAYNAGYLDDVPISRVFREIGSDRE